MKTKLADPEQRHENDPEIAKQLLSETRNKIAHEKMPENVA
jgi:hypothetical protein